MAIEERRHYEPAVVVYFDSRRGTGKCRTRAGRTARIPLAAVREAKLVTLDPGDAIFVAIDEHDVTRVERLHLPVDEK